MLDRHHLAVQHLLYLRFHFSVELEGVLWFFWLVHNFHINGLRPRYFTLRSISQLHLFFVIVISHFNVLGRLGRLNLSVNYRLLTLNHTLCLRFQI